MICLVCMRNTITAPSIWDKPESWHSLVFQGGFKERSRRREEADFCWQSSSASSRRRLRFFSRVESARLVLFGDGT